MSDYPNKKCKYLVTQKDMDGSDVLFYCKHKENVHDHEGNCHEDMCPLDTPARGPFDTAEECWQDFVKDKACCAEHLCKESYRRGVEAAASRSLPCIVKAIDNGSLNARPIPYWYEAQGINLSEYIDISELYKI